MKRLLSFSNLRLSFEILLVFALLFAVLTRQFSSKAAPSGTPEAPTALYWYQCNTPNHVAVFTNRVHIYCPSTTPVAGAPAIPNVAWFAFPTAPDSAEASRVLSVLQSSAIAGRTVWIETNPSDTSGSSFGCSAANCLRIYGLEMR